MKKNSLIVIIIIVIMFLLMWYLTMNKNTKTQNNLTQNNLTQNNLIQNTFGNEYCTNYDEDGQMLSPDKMHMVPSDMVKHICTICSKEYEDSSGCIDLCDECAEKTGRCNVCGGIIPEE